MQRRTKVLIIFGAALALISFCLFLFFYHPQKLLEVDFLNVGQGDAELIKTPYGQTILIDGGPDNKVMSELGRNLPWLDRKIDLVINTHPHDDHVSGLIDILKKYQVERILMTAALTHPASLGSAPLPRGEYAPPFEEFLKVRAEKKTPIIIVAGPEKITLGPDLILEIIYPDKNDLGADLNEDSIVARLIYKNKTFLFVGDAGNKTEAELLAEKIDLKAGVLKVGHHGSETSSSLDFLRAVSPQIAVIECGPDNQFGFPKPDTLWRLAKIGAQTFRTDLNGTIKIKSDGNKIEVKSQK
ncbi:MAG: ComEC/Rec2 family competence protein [Patescibacteria group bacterium]|nr:ComEC/Rec2 family competence protein [Patescibacteria group bacterium]